LQTLDCRAGLQRFANVLFCVVGFSFFFVCWEKKQNKFPSNCTALSTEHQSNQSVFSNYFNLFISYQCDEMRFFTLAYNVGVSFEADLRVILCPHTDKRMSGKPLLAYH
jgi:hypothetical protein